MAERVQREAVAGKIPGLSRVIRDTKFQIAAGLSLLAAITAACAPAQAKEGQNNIVDSNPPAATATQEIPTSKPPATAEAQKNPEKKPLFSKLFPGVDISNAEIFPYTDATGTIDLVAIDLSPKVTLTAPTSSERFATAEANTPYSGSWAGFTNETGTGITVIGNYKLLIEAPAGVKIEEGQAFGVTVETDHKNPSGKTIIVQIAKRDPNTRKWYTPREEVEKYFPGIYSKPKAKAINYEGPVKGVTTYDYSGGPNDSR